MSAVLSISGVSKSYANVVALDDVSLEIADGEVVAVVGPSGGGKTTLLKTMNLLALPDCGSILFRGKEIYSRSNDPKLGKAVFPKSLMNWFLGDHWRNRGEQFFNSAPHKFRRNFGMVFQEFNLWPSMTVEDNISAPLKWTGRYSKEEIASRTEAYARRVQISGLLNRFPTELSGGERQRAGIARALVGSPSVLLLDEVTSALDPELVGEILDLVSSLREERRSMVVVTHHMNFARRIADRVLFIEGGRVVRQGAPEEILRANQGGRLGAFLSRFEEK